jgi:predicted RND superfamily exporter protein
MIDRIVSFALKQPLFVVLGLAVVVIGGLVSATLLTLIVLPTFCLMLERRSARAHARSRDRQ